jgi:hypothetical protein
LESCGIEAFVPAEAPGSFTTSRAWEPMTELQVFESESERAITVLNKMQIRSLDQNVD